MNATALDLDDYKGEIAPRSKVVATILTALHPTLGYLYIGQSVAAVGAAFFFTFYLTTFMVLWSALQFFPILPLVVFFTGWFLFVVLCLLGILRHMRNTPTDYILQSYNHPVVYVIIYVLVGMLPGQLAWFTSTEVLWSIVQVNDPSMYPGLMPGDVILVDRFAYLRPSALQPGEGVVLREGDGKRQRVHLGRVVGLPGDEVSSKDGNIFVNYEPLKRFFYEDETLTNALAATDASPNARRFPFCSIKGRALGEASVAARALVRVSSS